MPSKAPNCYTEIFTAIIPELHVFCEMLNLTYLAFWYAGWQPFWCTDEIYWLIKQSEASSMLTVNTQTRTN